MKYIIILFLLVSCTKEITEEEQKCNIYIEELIEMGYSIDWATHKAKVEFGYLPEDEKYLAIEED